MHRLPVIGSAYQPTRLVRRGPTHFTALRAPMSDDDVLVQEAMLAPQQPRSESTFADLMVLAVAIASGVAVCVLILTGAIYL